MRNHDTACGTTPASNRSSALSRSCRRGVHQRSATLALALVLIGTMPRAAWSQATEPSNQRLRATELVNQGVRLAVMENDRGGALAKFQEAVRVDPTYARAHVDLANLLRLLQRYDEAHAALDRADEARPDYQFARHVRSRLLRDEAVELHRQGERDEAALAKFDAAIRVDPEYALAHMGRAHVLRDLRQLTAARHAAERGLELDPDLTYGQQVRDWIADAEAETRVAEVRQRRAAERARREAAERSRRAAAPGRAAPRPSQDCEEGALDAGETLGAVAGILGGKSTDRAMRDARDCGEVGGSGFDGVTRGLEEINEELRRRNAESEAEFQARLREYQREAQRRDRARRETRRRERERAAAERRHQQEERQQARREAEERQERERRQQAEDRTRSEREHMDRIRVRIEQEGSWSDWMIVPSRSGLRVRIGINRYGESVDRWEWHIQFRNDYRERVCYSYRLAVPGTDRTNHRHCVGPDGSLGAVMLFYLPAAPGEPAEIMVDNFCRAAEDGCWG